MTEFVDRVKVQINAGNGGHGCASVRREKFKPLGGPDGADGGHGGNVIFEVDPQVTTLLGYHHRPVRSAENGTPGQGGMRLGKNGESLVLPVPQGTVIKSEQGEILVDLSMPGQRYLAARGGIGGRGNASLASRRRKAPGFALLGEPGEQKNLVLELKSVADVALVGFPSAGKSSLIAAMSSARPKIADYPFTTLVPNLGVVQAGDYRYTVADVPGLIEGASQGRGLGHDFLRHIERCSVIVHVLDTATFEVDRDPVSDLAAIENELGAYQADLGQVEGYVPLAQRPRLVVLNKIDIPDGRELADLVEEDLRQAGYEVLRTSAVTHEGLNELRFRMGELVEEHRVEPSEPSAVPVLIRPVEDSPTDSITVEAVGLPQGRVFQIRGRKPERWVAQTDFSNDEAVGFLADRLSGAGVEDQLAEVGARPGDTVVIGELEGGVIFDWEPTLSSGAELLGARGSDTRLEENFRRTNRQRREEYRRMMDAKAAAREELWTEREEGIWTDPSSE